MYGKFPLKYSYSYLFIFIHMDVLHEPPKDAIKNFSLASLTIKVYQRQLMKGSKVAYL